MGLQALISRSTHKVGYTDEAIKGPVELVGRATSPTGKLPDRQIDVIDASRARPDAAGPKRAAEAS